MDELVSADKVTSNVKPSGYWQDSFDRDKEHAEAKRLKKIENEYQSMSKQSRIDFFKKRQPKSLAGEGMAPLEPKVEAKNRVQIGRLYYDPENKEEGLVSKEINMKHASDSPFSTATDGEINVKVVKKRKVKRQRKVQTSNHSSDGDYKKETGNKKKKVIDTEGKIVEVKKVKEKKKKRRAKGKDKDKDKVQ